MKIRTRKQLREFGIERGGLNHVTGSVDIEGNRKWKTVRIYEDGTILRTDVCVSQAAPMTVESAVRFLFGLKK